MQLLLPKSPATAATAAHITPASGGLTSQHQCSCRNPATCCGLHFGVSTGTLPSILKKCSSKTKILLAECCSCSLKLPPEKSSKLVLMLLGLVRHHKARACRTWPKALPYLGKGGCHGMHDLLSWSTRQDIFADVFFVFG